MDWKSTTEHRQRVRVAPAVLIGTVALGLLIVAYGPKLLEYFWSRSAPKVDPIEAQFLATAQQWGAVARWPERLRGADSNLTGVYLVEMQDALLQKPGERFVKSTN